MNARTLLATAALLAACLAAPAHGTESAAALVARGEAHMQAGRLDAALDALQRAVSADPASSLARTRLGGAHLLRREHAQALRQFQQAISLDPANAGAFVGLAIAYLHQGRHALARAALEEAARLDATRQAEIDRLLAWLDQRGAGHH